MTAAWQVFERPDTLTDLLPETEPMPPRRVLMRDKTLPHQIQLNYSTKRGQMHVVVGCNCGRLRRVVTDADEALGHYRDHLTREGVDHE
jgi:hypothetical protein